MDEFLEELYDLIVDEEAEKLGINISDEKYHIMGDSQANFFLRRLSELEAENQKINEMCDAEIQAFVDKVNKFRESKLKTNKGTMDYFNTLLEKYAHSQLDGTKKKSLKLPFGTLQFRTSPEKLNYVDPEVVLKMLQNNNMNELVRTKTEIDKTNLKKAINIIDGKAYLNGVELAGVEVEPPQTSFSVKI